MAERTGGPAQEGGSPLRIVTAPRPARTGGTVSFHPGLTVLVGPPARLADWAASLLDVDVAPETVVHDPRGGESRSGSPVVDLTRGGPYPSPVRVRLGDLDADDLEVDATARTRNAIRAELRKWERALDEARARLVARRGEAARVGPSELAEAARLRNEWRYAEQAQKQVRRGRSRRTVDDLKQRYRDFLTRFGASSYEDLAVVGTGFGATPADLAIREAATVVSMAEQRCDLLREELARAEAPPGAGGADVIPPLVVEDSDRDLPAASRRAAFELLVARSRDRQVILCTDARDLVALARGAGEREAGVRRVATVTPSR